MTPDADASFPHMRERKIYLGSRIRRRCSFGCKCDYSTEHGYLTHLEREHGLTIQRWMAEDVHGNVQSQFTLWDQRRVLA